MRRNAVPPDAAISAQNALLWDHFEQKIKALSEDPEVEWVDVIDLSDLLGKNQSAPGAVS